MDTGRMLCLDVYDGEAAIDQALLQLNSFMAPPFWPKYVTTLIGSIHIQLVLSVLSFDPSGVIGLSTCIQLHRVMITLNHNNWQSTAKLGGTGEWNGDESKDKETFWFESTFKHLETGPSQKGHVCTMIWPSRDPALSLLYIPAGMSRDALSSRQTIYPRKYMPGNFDLYREICASAAPLDLVIMNCARPNQALPSRLRCSGIPTAPHGTITAIPEDQDCFIPVFSVVREAIPLQKTCSSLTGLEQLKEVNYGPATSSNISLL
ncbi:hypothetical protein C8R43DRAFT_958149 [Mycena crocata]|nr:hypothetical protein C8R43DRAFT_958149 [Mycena crocata]